MGWIRIMNNLCRKGCGGRRQAAVEKTSADEAAAAMNAADLAALKEGLNFRLLWGGMDFRLRHEIQQHIPDGDRVLWVEDIRLASCRPPSVDAAEKKKPSLWGRMKDCLLGRRAARQGSSPHKKK